MGIVSGNKTGAPFNGGTVTAPLDISTGVDQVALELVAPAGMGNNIFHAATVVGPAELSASVDNASATIGVDGGGGTGGATLGADASGGTVIAGGPTWDVALAGDTVADRITVNGGGPNVLTVDPNGYLLIATHTAPADAALDAGECALWLDQTNGAAKLMLKGKTANGTVATGSVTLT